MSSSKRPSKPYLFSALAVSITMALPVAAQRSSQDAGAVSADTTRAPRQPQLSQSTGLEDKPGAGASSSTTGKLVPAKPTSTKGDPAKTDAAQSTKNPDASASAGLPLCSPLAAAITIYKSHPDNQTWQQVWQCLHDMVASPLGSKANATALLRANPALMELGAKVDDAAGAKVWSFPKVSESQAVLVQWQQSVGAPKTTVIGRGRHKTVIITPAPTITRLQSISLPATIVFRDAQIVRSGGMPAAKGKPGKPAYSALVLTGNERGGGTIWVAAYKPSEGAWVESAQALSGIPPYLLQNVAGRASFSGNDLVLAVNDSDRPAGGPQSSGYKIVCKFVDGKFAVEGKPEEGPAIVVAQFMQAIQQNKLDLACAWLSDPKLIAIAKYAGLISRPPDRPFKVIPMSAPLLAGSRFRLMTFEKQDLIVDVGKVKQQWAIKALYIAPPDPLAQKLVGSGSASGQEHAAAVGEKIGAASK